MRAEEALKIIAPFLERLTKPRYDKYETNDYICDSTNCKDALEAYKKWKEEGRCD